MAEAPAAGHLAAPIAWTLCFQYFVAELIARSGWTLPYSARFNYISDLGAVLCVTGGSDPVCSPLHAVMNGSFVLQGVLIVTGVVLGRGWLPAGRAVAIARVLLVLSGVLLALVGVFPEDVNPPVHRLVAAVHFVCADLGMLLLGRALGAVTVICGAVGIVGLALLGARLTFGLGIGTIERIAAYPFPFWLCFTGASLLVARFRLSASPAYRR